MHYIHITLSSLYLPCIDVRVLFQVYSSEKKSKLHALLIHFQLDIRLEKKALAARH